MKYQEAIKRAKRLAKLNDEIFVVFWYRFHWWQRRKYDCCTQSAFYEVLPDYPLIKLLTITPTGTITQ